MNTMERKTSAPHPISKAASQSICLAPIAGCLIKCEQAIGSAGQWLAVNDEQSRFLAEYYRSARPQVHALPELESIAATDAETINRFLEQRGFQIRLEPFSQDPPRIGLASVFKLLLEWLAPGTVTTVRKGEFPAVRMTELLSFSFSAHGGNPIVSIPAKNDDTVHMTVMENPPASFELAALTGEIMRTMRTSVSYDGVVFPMVTYDEEIDISWIKEMEIQQGIASPWVIEQALQQTKFRMNELGAKVESAAAMVVKLRCGIEKRPDLVIDRPFLLWVTRKGMTHPLFIGHFTESNWKKPDSL